MDETVGDNNNHKKSEHRPDALPARYPDKIVVQSESARLATAMGLAIAAAANRDAMIMESMLVRRK